jgi:hypothetical protein
MLKGMRNFVVVASCLGAAVVCVRVAAAQSSGATTGHSITDSPYTNGPPAITGGYTDTSQGGTKTSGDMAASPPGAPAQGAAKSGQEQTGPDIGHQGEAQGSSEGPSGR